MPKIKRKKVAVAPQVRNVLTEVALLQNAVVVDTGKDKGWPKFSVDDEFSIDCDFLRRYPLEEYREQYSQSGAMAKSLVLTGISRSQAIFQFFKNVQKLTLERVDIGESSLVYFPGSLQSLKLSDCSVDKATLHSLLGRMKNTLKVLHLDRIRCDTLQAVALAKPAFQDVLTNIRELTLEGMDMKQCAFLAQLTNLESLSVIAAIGCVRMPNRASKLRYLRIELGRNGSVYTPSKYYELKALESLIVRGLNPEGIWATFQFGKAFKTFECHDAPTLHWMNKMTDWKSLQHVKVFCHQYDKEKLLKHYATLKGIQNYEVTSCEPSPRYNFLTTLNENVLKMIFSYLEDKDKFNLAHVDSRFIFFQPTVCIDAAFLKVYPPEKNQGLYKRIGAHATELIVYGGFDGNMKEEDFYRFIGHCKNLKRLSLKNLMLYDTTRATEIPMVEELRLKVCMSFSNCDPDTREYDVAKGIEYWSAVMKHLNPKLKRLQLDGGVSKLKMLKWLTNIEWAYLDLTYLKVGSAFLPRFFKQNTKLSHLEINRYSYYPGWDAIRPGLEAINVDSLRSLTFLSDIDGFSMGTEQAKFLRRFKNLVHFGVKQWVDDLEEDLQRPCTLTDREMWGSDLVFASYFKACPKLKMMSIEYVAKHSFMLPSWLFERLLEPCLERLRKYRPIEQDLKENGFKMIFFKATTKK